MTQLRCISCGRTQRVLSFLVECPSCGDLLDPVLDVTALRKKTAKAWRSLLDARASSVQPADRSGVWAHHEWVLPEIGDTDVVTLGEGRSPLVDIEPKTFVKQCFSFLERRQFVHHRLRKFLTSSCEPAKRNVTWPPERS